MQHLPALFADIEQIVQVVLLLLFILGPFLFRLIGGSERQPDRTPPRRRPRPAAPGQKPQPPGQSTPLESEIEDFLRRAEAQRRGTPPAEVEVIEPRPQPGHTLAKRAGQRDVDIEILDAQVVPDEGLGTPLSSSINTSEFERRSERLGDRVEHADDAMEARLHAVFDHGLGDLSRRSASVATAGFTPAPEESPAPGASERAAASAVAASLAARLRSPQGMREAIVLREILERPEHRW
jgi:hypothetical protein